MENNTTKKQNNVKALIIDLSSDMYDFYFNDYINNFDIILFQHHSRNLQNYNHEIIENIFEALNHYDEIKRIYNNDFQEFSKDYKIEKVNNEKWNKKEIKTFESIEKIYNDPNYRYKFYTNDNIIKLLSIIKCKKYNYACLSGFSQGENITLYYNADEVNENTIKLIESLYFGGCKEILFTLNDIRKIDKIFNCDYESFIIPFGYNKKEIEKGIKAYYNKDNIKITIYEAVEKQVIKLEYNKI